MMPKALLSALAVCGTLSLLTLVGVRHSLATDRHRLLLLGDSVISNYRVAVGARVEDVLGRKLGPRWSVRSFAEPGSRIGDYYLLFAKAELLGFEPETVVIELNPSKLVQEFDLGTDLDDDGRELMWLPLNAEGAAYYARLSPHYRDATLWRKASLFFGFYDAIERTWRQRIAWPRRRARLFAENAAERCTRFKPMMVEHAERWSRTAPAESYAEFRHSSKVGDLDFLLDALNRRGTRSYLLLPPWPNPGVLGAFTPRGRALLTQIRGYALRYAAERNVPVIALDDPDVLQRFRSDDWDDLEHWRSPGSYRTVAELVANRIADAEQD